MSLFRRNTPGERTNKSGSMEEAFGMLQRAEREGVPLSCLHLREGDLPNNRVEKVKEWLRKLTGETLSENPLSEEQKEFIASLKGTYHENPHGIPLYDQLPWAKIEGRLRAFPLAIDTLSTMQKDGTSPAVVSIVGHKIVWAELPTEEVVDRKGTLFLPLYNKNRDSYLPGEPTLMTGRCYLHIVNTLGIKLNGGEKVWLKGRLFGTGEYSDAGSISEEGEGKVDELDTLMDPNLFNVGYLNMVVT